MLTFSHQVSILVLGMSCMAILGQPHRQRCTSPEGKNKKDLHLKLFFTVPLNHLCFTQETLTNVSKTKSTQSYSKPFFELQNALSY